MAKKITLLLIVLFIGGHSYAQTATQQRIDSLLQSIDQTEADTSRVLTLLRISAAHNPAKPIEEIKYASEAYTLSLDLQYERGIIESINLIGSGFLEMEQYDTALSCFLTILSMYEANTDTLGISKAYNNIGNVYFAKNYQEQALDYFYKSLYLRLPNATPKDLAGLYNNIGAAYQENNIFDSAAKYFELALANKRHLKGTVTYGITQGNMGSMYVMSNRPKAGHPYLDSARAIFSAEAAYSTLSLVYRLVADGWSKLGVYDSALIYLDSAQVNAKKGNSGKTLTNIYKSYARTYNDIGQCDLAYSYQKQANTLQDSIESSQSTANLLNIKHLYEMQQQQNLRKIQEQKINTKKNSIIFNMANL